MYGLPPVWTLMWVFKFPEWLNTLSHTWHLYGFSPLWILLCVTRFLASVNCLLQTVHSNGFSAEWICLWIARWWLLRQHLLHSVHLYLPLWIFICWHRPLWDENRFSHWAHEYKFSSVCLIAVWLKTFFSVNRLSHTVYKSGLGLSSCGCSVISLLSSSVLILDDLSPAQYAQHYPLHSLTATHCTMFISICHLQQSFSYISDRYRREGKVCGVLPDPFKQTYMKTETCKLYSRVFWIFLPNITKIDPYHFELYCFKFGPFFETQCIF